MSALRAPAGLGSAGKNAWRRALAAIPPAADDRFWDAAARYARAVDRAEAARFAWESAGGPLIAEQANGVISEHPLLKVLTGSERDAARFGAACCLEPAAAVKRAPRSMVEKNNRAPDRASEPPRIRRVA